MLSKMRGLSRQSASASKAGAAPILQISGMPRSGSTLLLLMLAASVTNRTVYTQRETSHLKDPRAIGKCPFAVIHKQHDPKDLILTIRDPAYIVTSNTHGDWPGQYPFGWTEAESCAKKGLQRHWQAMRPYLAPKLGRGAFIVRYEDLVSDPDSVQAALKAEFGLEYRDRQWSNWPDGFKTSDYWSSALGPLRPLSPRVQLDLAAQLRVGSISAQYPDFNECRRVLGYAP